MSKPMAEPIVIKTVRIPSALWAKVEAALQAGSAPSANAYIVRAIEEKVHHE